MKNEIIRRAMFEYGLKQYQLAKILGISEASVSVMLRYDLSVAEQKQIAIQIENGIAKKDSRPKTKSQERPRVNKAIYDELKNRGVAVWQLAEAMGLSESRLYAKLRKEMDKKETDRIIWIINHRSKYMSMIGLSEEVNNAE